MDSYSQTLLLMNLVRLLVDMICVTAFALSGVIAARDRKTELDVFGIVIVAVITAVGGGTLRDIILRVPVFWIVEPKFIFLPIVAGVFAFFCIKERPNHNIDLLVNLLDAVGLAYFSVLGTAKSLTLSADPGIAVLMGLMTGVCGGMMRDAYTGQVPFVMRKNGEIYGIASLVAGIIVVTVPGNLGLWLGGLACLVLRLGAMRWKWRLPSVSW